MTSRYATSTLSMFGGQKLPDVWFTANWQLGQQPDRDADLIDRHNALVEQTDWTWMLGNMVATPDALRLVPSIKGRKVLIAGPGDACFAGNEADPKALARLDARYRDAGFDNIVNGAAFARKGWAMRLPLGPQREVFWLSHFPYAQAGDVDHTVYRPKRPAGGSAPWLLCGAGGDQWHSRNRMINVSIDAWRAPVPLEIINETITNGDGDDG